MQKFKLVTCILIAKHYIEVGNVFLGHPVYGDFESSTSFFDLRSRSKGDLCETNKTKGEHLMRLDKGNILKPTPGLYLIPMKSYKQKRTLKLK